MNPMIMFTADIIMLVGIAMTIDAAWHQPNPFNLFCVLLSLAIFAAAQLNKVRLK